MTYNIPLDVKVVDPSTTSNQGVPRDVRIVDADGNAAQLIFDNLTATTAPTANDDSGDNYTVGSRWVDVTADKAYICVDATVGSAVWQEVAATIVDPLVYKGTIDCTSDPNYPAGDAGYIYVVSSAGKIGGASGEDVEAGDMIICNTDGSVGGTEVAVGDEWDTVQGNIDGAVTADSVLTDNAIVRGDGGARGVQTSSVLIDDSDNITGVTSLTTSDLITDIITEETAANGVEIVTTRGLEIWRQTQSDVGLFFKTSSEASGYVKNAIIIDASGSYAQGDMNFCANYDNNANSASLSDMIFKMTSAGLEMAAGKTIYGTTFDTNVAAAKLQISGTTIEAAGTDATISIVAEPKGSSGFFEVTNTIGRTMNTTTDTGAGSIYRFRNTTDNNSVQFGLVGSEAGIYIQTGGASDGTGLTEAFRITSAQKVGILTTAPDKQVEINSADGNNLRLTYNDSNGSAANYCDFLTTSDGDLTIDPSGGDVTIDGILYSTGLSVAADSDVTVTLGRAKIGYDGTNADLAAWGHIDNMSWPNWAIGQNANGDTILNAKSGRTIFFDLGGATFGTFTSSGFDVNSSYISSSRNGIAATSTDGLILQNTTNATVGVPVQMSPRARWHTEIWDTDGSNDTWDWTLEATGTSGSTTSSQMNLSYSKNGAAYVTPIAVTNDYLYQTGITTIMQSGATLDVRRYNIGTGSYDGVQIKNLHPATAGVTQQYSARLRMAGTAWDSDDTTSRKSSFIITNKPQTGATVSGLLDIEHELDDGGYSSVMSLASDGTVNIKADTDIKMQYGRAAIGYNGTFSDYASFGHLDYVATNGYAIAQNAGGTTFLKSNDFLYVSSNGFSHNSLVTKPYSGTLADDGTITLPTGVSGELSVWDGTNYGIWFVKTDGTCILGPSQGLCDDADTNGYLCVYDGGSGAVIKNRTGGSVTIRYIYNYS